MQRLAEDVRLGVEDADSVRLIPGPMFDSLVRAVYAKVAEEWWGCTS
jgi:hypothetical protein